MPFTDTFPHPGPRPEADSKAETAWTKAYRIHAMASAADLIVAGKAKAEDVKDAMLCLLIDALEAKR